MSVEFGESRVFLSIQDYELETSPLLVRQCRYSGAQNIYAEHNKNVRIYDTLLLSRRPSEVHNECFGFI